MAPAPDLGILFTAFEPSGDAHAAPVIEALRATRPNIPIYAFGGPRMAAAGAQLIEVTTGDAVMLAGSALKVFEHSRRLRRLKRFLRDNPIQALVPVDSPAANWSICKLVRRRQPKARIVHLVAPQLWAWAPWRIMKLRRLTDHVLCLLSFEPGWFNPRLVPSTYVGHPIFDPAAVAAARRDGGPQLLEGQPKLALLPGSRPGEIKRNWPTMLKVFEELSARYPEMSAVVAAVDEEAAERVRNLTLQRLRRRPWPLRLAVHAGQTDAILRWCDLALVVSGTATLQVTAHAKPMVVLYRASRLAWHLLGRWLVRTRVFSLPNVIGQYEGIGRVVPEYIPHFSGTRLIVRDLEQLIETPGARQSQRIALDRVASSFGKLPFGPTAAQQILRIILPRASEVQDP